MNGVAENSHYPLMGSGSIGKLPHCFITEGLALFCFINLSYSCQVLEIRFPKEFFRVLNPFLASKLKLKDNYIPILQYKKHQIPRKIIV